MMLRVKWCKRRITSNIRPYCKGLVLLPPFWDTLIVIAFPTDTKPNTTKIECHIFPIYSLFINIDLKGDFCPADRSRLNQLLTLYIDDFLMNSETTTYLGKLLVTSYLTFTNPAATWLNSWEPANNRPYWSHHQILSRLINCQEKIKDRGASHRLKSFC